MIKLFVILFQKISEDIVPAVVGGGGFVVLLSDLNLILKVLVGIAVLIYYGIKINKERKK
jgi:arginine exporter protein ArgO